MDIIKRGNNPTRFRVTCTRCFPHTVFECNLSETSEHVHSLSMRTVACPVCKICMDFNKKETAVG